MSSRAGVYFDLPDGTCLPCGFGKFANSGNKIRSGFRLMPIFRNWAAKGWLRRSVGNNAFDARKRWVMTESESNATPMENTVGAQSQRLPPLQQLSAAVAYMREAANSEFKRAGDTRNAMLLPVSCVLLVTSICLSCPPALRALAFVVPLFCFMYYIANRIGIVRTFNPRQAYLTWHVLIATFLMGGTFALFLVYAGACLMMYAAHGSP